MEGIVVSPGQTVLLLWSGTTPTEDLQLSVSDLQKQLGNGRVQVEHIERLTMAKHSTSTFDVAISGLIQPCTAIHDTALLGEICRILKSDGQIYIGEVVTGMSSDESKAKMTQKLNSNLTLSGFVKISQPTVLSLSDDTKQALIAQYKTQNVGLAQVTAHKPSYEVGASTQLKISFAKKKTEPAKVTPSTAAVWSLSAMDIEDEDVELVDDDELLDADDLKRPDPGSLKAECGVGPDKKKKACKNCTCGLADELDAEADSKQTKTATSACGSCYLGDAFRCSSCPYLGMPAFKPGQKIQLSDRQLKADR